MSRVPDEFDAVLTHFFGPLVPRTPKTDHVLRDYFYGQRPCPVCHETGGFHDRETHDEHEVPRELLKESGWHKSER